MLYQGHSEVKLGFFFLLRACGNEENNNHQHSQTPPSWFKLRHQQFHPPTISATVNTGKRPITNIFYYYENSVTPGTRASTEHTVRTARLHHQNRSVGGWPPPTSSSPYILFQPPWPLSRIFPVETLRYSFACLFLPGLCFSDSASSVGAL